MDQPCSHIGIAISSGNTCGKSRIHLFVYLCRFVYHVLRTYFHFVADKFARYTHRHMHRCEFKWCILQCRRHCLLISWHLCVRRVSKRRSILETGLGIHGGGACKRRSRQRLSNSPNDKFTFSVSGCKQNNSYQICNKISKLLCNQ